MNLPPFTTTPEFASQLLGQLRLIDALENQIRFEMTFLNKTGKDVAPPDASRGIEEGDTYADVLKRCQERRDRFYSDYADVMPLVEKMHARQDAEQQAAQAALDEQDEAKAVADASSSS